MVTLRLLGGMSLSDGSREEVRSLLSHPKQMAVLVYAALEGRGGYVRRDALMGLLWPESDIAHARNALNQALYALRRGLGRGVLTTRGKHDVGLDRARFACDVWSFREALDEGDHAAALARYTGELLPGFYVSGGGDFERWLQEERGRLREAAADAAWRCAHGLIAAGALTEAERAGQRALDLVPTDESPVRAFIEALAGAGDRAAAVNFFEKFRARLADELELEPSRATAEVAEAIRNGVVDNGSHDPRTPPEKTPMSAGMPPSLVRDSGGKPSSDALPVPVQERPRRRWWAWVGTAVAGIAVVAGLTALNRTPSVGAPPPDRPYTVLARVGGSAEEAEREAAAFLLRTGLDMAHVVRTVPTGEVQRTLRLMEQDPGAPLEPALAQEVAVRLGVSTVVLPRLDRFGDRHVLSLRVEDADGGALHFDARGSARNRGEIVEMVDEVVREVQRKLGESREVLAAMEPLPRVLTPSLEALEKYRLAGQAGPGQARLAVLRLTEAVAADTAFAMAWQLMASYYGNYLGEPDSAEVAARQVQRYRDRLSQARRADLDLHRRMRSDVALWDVALEEAERAVRRDPRYLSNYSVYLSLPGGLPDSALAIRLRLERERVEAARSFDPDARYVTPCFVGSHYLAAALDRVDDWRTLMDSLDIEVPPGCSREVALFETVAAGEWDRVDSMVTHGPGDWPWPTAVETALLQMAPLRGRIRDGGRMPSLQHAETKALRPDHYGFSNIAHLVLQVAYGLSPGEAAEETFAGGVPRELERRGRDEVTDYVLYGVRESLLGDTLESKRVSRRLRAMRDSATSRTFERGFEPWFALLDVGPAFRRGDWQVVVETLEPGAERIHEPGVGSLAGDDYLVWWLLAEAHVRLGRPDAAIPHLESILERPRFRLRGWMLQGYIQPAARFELARLHAQIGDARKSEEHYRAFLDLFTDPDPEFAWMVEEARKGLL
jgi:DNA-binding SARP family transcriptional activator